MVYFKIDHYDKKYNLFEGTMKNSILLKGAVIITGIFGVSFAAHADPECSSTYEYVFQYNDLCNITECLTGSCFTTTIQCDGGASAQYSGDEFDCPPGPIDQ